jgi:outer membrane cobalamin receptor
MIVRMWRDECPLRRRVLPFLMLSGLAAAQTNQLQIRVIDSQGGAVPESTVQVRCGGDTTKALTADSLGEVRIACPPPAALTVSAPGFEPIWTTLTRWNEAQPQTFTLSPAMVRDSVDVVVSGNPVVPAASEDSVAIDRTGARTVFDAVERLVPGAFVTHRGVLGYGISSNGTGQINIRGVGGSPNTDVLIVVDGRPDFQGEMGHPLPDFFSLSDVGRVSVTEGPASVLYGSNAMGGVVEIDPLEPSRRNETQLTASLGSFLTGQYRLSNGGMIGRFYYDVTGGISHTNGDRDYSHFREGDGSVLLGYDLSSHWKTSVDGRYGHFLVEDPGPVGAPSQANYAGVGRGGFSANLDDAYGRLYGSIRVYGSYGRNFISDGFRSIDDATGFRLDQTFAVKPTLLIEVGSDERRYGGEAHQEPGGANYGTHHINEEAGFAIVQWTPIHHLRLHAGYRYQANSQFGGLSVPEAGGSFAFSDRYSLAFNASRGFRNPTIRELYLFPAPNPNLLPETMWNYQASFHARPARRVHAWTTVYYASLDNLVVTLGHWPNMNLLNAGNALNRGVEVSSEWTPFGHVRVQGGYSYLRSTNLQPYVPQNKLNYSIEIPIRRLTANFSGISVGRRPADTTHTSYMSGYTNAALRLSYPLTERSTVFALVDNLFNQRYEFIPGYPMPGTTATGGVTFRF